MAFTTHSNVPMAHVYGSAEPLPWLGTGTPASKPSDAGGIPAMSQW